MLSLTSGFIGALITTVLTIVYMYVSAHWQLRKDILLDVVTTCDDIRNQLDNMYAQKEFGYEHNKLFITEEEYQKVSRNVSVLLNSASLKAKVAYVYGENDELGLLNQVYSHYVDASGQIRKSTRSAWIVKEKKKINETFDELIDPSRRELEKLLLKNSRPLRILFLKPIQLW